jgi:hypothetical protein
MLQMRTPPAFFPSSRLTLSRSVGFAVTLLFPRINLHHYYRRRCPTYLHGPKRSVVWVVDDSTLIEPTKDYYNDFMQRTFRGWEDSGAHVKEIWTGNEYSSSVGYPPRRTQR